MLARLKKMNFIRSFPTLNVNSNTIVIISRAKLFSATVMIRELVIFFHYFSYNFEKLKLKKLITTCYRSQQVDLFSRNDSEKSHISQI